jgi:drug/metabolite transporter (DMT)-like permease
MRKAFFQLHIAVFLAGFTGILGRLITLDEALLVWYRLLIAVPSFLVLYYFKQKLRRVGSRDLIKIFGVGVVAALHWVFFYGSIQESNVSIALVCFSSIGFFTALIEPFVMNQSIKLTEILLGLLTIAGIYLIFHFDPAFKTGIIIGLISAVLGSVFPILNRKLLQRIEPETVTFFELVGGLLFLTLVIPLYIIWFPPDYIIPTWTDVGWLLVLSWICTVVAFDLLMKALHKISAFTVNLSYNLEPLYGILLAFIIYREDNMLDKSFYWGMGLILLSVVIQTMLIYRKHGRLQNN